MKRKIPTRYGNNNAWKGLSEPELRRYVERGGRLVATGLTGTRHGPDHNLAARGTAFTIHGATIVTNRPGVDYWRRNSDAAAAKAMADLLATAPVAPRLETDAPAIPAVSERRKKR